MKKAVLSAVVFSLFGLSSNAAQVTCQTSDSSRSIVIHDQEKSIEFIDNGGSASVAIGDPSIKVIETRVPIWQSTYAVGQYNLIVEFPSGSAKGTAKLVEASSGALRMTYPTCDKQ